MDELINHSDTEFIAPEEIELTDNAIILTPEANVYVVDEGATHTKELAANKKPRKSRKKRPQSHGNSTFLHILESIVFSSIL